MSGDSSFLSGIKSEVGSNKRLLTYTLGLNAAIVVGGILWHYSILRIGSYYTVGDIPAAFFKTALFYSITGMVLSSLVLKVAVSSTGTVLKRAFCVFLGLFLAFTVVVRMFDWGALYFGGNHIDDNFWAHAFFADGLVYLITPEAFALYAVNILFAALIIIMTRGIFRAVPLGKGAVKG